MDITTTKDFVDKACGRFYDVWIYRYDSIHNRPTSDADIRLMEHLRLENINGLGIGQVHFTTDDGGYVLLPWCMMYMMLPSKQDVGL